MVTNSWEPNIDQCKTLRQTIDKKLKSKKGIKIGGYMTYNIINEQVKK